MVLEEFVGGNLVRHYSDKSLCLKQVETGIVYEEAIDTMPCQYTYEETDIHIEEE